MIADDAIPPERHRRNMAQPGMGECHDEELVALPSDGDPLVAESEPKSDGTDCTAVRLQGRPGRASTRTTDNSPYGRRI